MMENLIYVAEKQTELLVEIKNDFNTLCSDISFY